MEKCKSKKLVGLEMCYNAHKTKLNCKEDCLVMASHVFLLNLDMKCVGIGENWETGDKPSEMLPPEWNSQNGVYTLRYVSPSGGRFYLKALICSDQIFLDISNIDEDSVSSVSLSSSEYVSEELGDFLITFKNMDKFCELLEKEVFENFISKVASAHKKDGRPKNIPKPDSNTPNSLYFPPYGSGDLDPTGRGQGGMLFDPRGRNPPSGNVPPGVPEGSVPPGARFDPIGGYVDPFHPSRRQQRHGSHDIFHPHDFTDL